MLERRMFLKSSLAAAGALSLPAGSALAAGLDPQNPDILFGTTGSIFGGWNINPQGRGTLQMSQNMRMMLQDCKHYGLEGFEPYSGQVAQYLDNVGALQALSRETGVTIACIGDLPRRPNSPPLAEPGQYPWLGQNRARLVSEMEAVARDLLQPLGVDHWKNNMGARPPGGPSDDQLKGLADTANEIGMRTKRHGVRLSLHPHTWGPMEREHEFRRVMELTDPNYVYLILDTGHNVLGGMDTVKIVDEYFARITEFHLKDTFPQYRGNSATPAQDQHYQKSVYASVGQGGGVDFPGIFEVARKKRFKGWVVFDIDAPRPGDGTGSVDDNLAASVNYLRQRLGIRLPQASGANGLFKPA
jgi:sugar phosphate isomerase/epimerase